MSERPLNFDCITWPRGDWAMRSPQRSLAYSATPVALRVLTKSRRFMIYTAGEMDVMVKSSSIIGGTSAVPGLS